MVSNDHDGIGRPFGPAPDIGAYEYAVVINDVAVWWLLQHGLDTNDAAALADQGGDGARTYQEWVAWTQPNNELSIFQITSVTMLSPTSAVFRWSSEPGKTYALFSSTNLPPQPLTQLVTGIPGTPPENVFTNGFVAEGVQYFWAEVSQ